MKIAVAQITTDPGNISGNTEKIIEYIGKAKARDADLVVFPELAIPGYLSLDLFLNDSYIEENLRALEKIKEHTEGISVVVGFADLDDKKIRSDGLKVRYNSAVVLKDKKILGVQDKTLLPDYDIFYENRYFHTARERKVLGLNGVKLGIQICEDLWDENYDVKVSEDLVSKGANLIVNISASPFYSGKVEERLRVVSKNLGRLHVPFVYANLVACQDGYEGEIVFDGQSMVFSKEGKLVKLGKAFEEDLVITDFSEKTVGYKRGRMENLYDALVYGIKEYFRRNGFSKAFIGLSGGIDSAVVAALAVEALGEENVTGISMPSRYSSEGSKSDAEELADNLGMRFESVAIESGFNAMEESLHKSFEGKEKDVTEENLQARLRGMVLMAYSNKFGGLVISTGNKTELALGYCTLYGDMSGGLAAISDVNKLDVYRLARYVNQKAGKEIIPESTIEKAPSAELSANQTDESGLGASYDVLSPLVDRIVEDQENLDSLVKDFPEELVKKMISKIHGNEHKRRQAAPGIKVTKKAFGVGRRIPIAHGFRK